MGVPSAIVIRRNNVEYRNNIEFCKYSIFELTCASLRDTGKFICRRFKNEFYKTFKKRSGRISSFSQYWVRKNKKYQDVPDLWVGIKGGAFYGIYQELGSEYQPKLGLLRKVVDDNIEEITQIQAQYLSALNTDNPLSRINNEDEEGSADD